MNTPEQAVADMSANEHEIILYTNHRCPYAHRAHIVLDELRLPYTEEIIDLDTPRPASYLAVNPRGLVPALRYDGLVVTESAIVAQFLADAHPSHLLPASNTPAGALLRARVAFFADAFMTKVQAPLMRLMRAKGADADEAVDAATDALVREVEPLLKDAGPFFADSDRLTMAEALVGPFVIRLLSLSKAGVYPASLLEKFQARAPCFWKWAQATSAHPSVTHVYDEQKAVEGIKKRLAALA